MKHFEDRLNAEMCRLAERGLNHFPASLDCANARATEDWSRNGNGLLITKRFFCRNGSLHYVSLSRFDGKDACPLKRITLAQFPVRLDAFFFTDGNLEKIAFQSQRLSGVIAPHQLDDQAAVSIGCLFDTLEIEIADFLSRYPPEKRIARYPSLTKVP